MVLSMIVNEDLMRTISPLIGLVSLGVTILTWKPFFGIKHSEDGFKKTSPEK